jgi:hypothetical protein
MPDKAQQVKRVVAVEPVGESLLVRRETREYRRQLLIAVVVFTVVAFLLAGYIVQMRTRPGLGLLTWVVVLLLLAVGERAWMLRAQSKRRELYRFSRANDVIERNGLAVAPLSEVDHILVRRIAEDPSKAQQSDVALVVALADTRRFTIAESTGVPGSQQEIEEAARQIADFAGVRVREDTRRPEEWWLDE